MQIPTALLEQISILAREIPRELAESVADAIYQMKDANWQYERDRIITSIIQPALRAQVSILMDTWKRENPYTTSGSLALALLSAVNTAEQLRQSESVSLVWTGPKTEIIPLRRTDQALLQVINEAKNQLLIVSFIIYKVEIIREAIIQAAEREVNIKICVEGADSGQGKITWDNIQALGESVAQKTKVYIWPISQRQQDMQGRYGSMHVKCAVADDNLLFISSANLTEYALNLNMELGVLIHGGKLPGNVARHFERFIENGVLVTID